MSATSSSHSRISPRFAVGILVLAAAVWGGVLFRQYHRTPAQRHIEAGSEYARRGDGLSAVREWQTAVKLEPDNAFAWQLLGQSFFEARQWRPAREALLQALRLRPDIPQIRSRLATCALSLGDPDSALKMGREELQHDPNDIPALEAIAAAQAKLGDIPERIRCLQRLTELEPQKVEPFRELAETLIGQNNLPETLPVADRIIQLAPNDADMYVLRGIARFYTDGTPAGMQRAEDDFLHALTLHPNLYHSYLYLGRIYRRRAQMEKAVAALETAVKLNPKKADAYFDLASAYERVGQAAKAAETRRRFQEIVREAEAFVHLKKRGDLAPNDFALQLRIGRLALQREDIEAARYYLGKANQLRPNDPKGIEALQQLGARSENAAHTPPSLHLPTSSVPPTATGGQ